MLYGFCGRLVPLLLKNNKWFLGTVALLFVHVAVFKQLMSRNDVQVK